MKTVEITESHYGYPNGKTKRYFQAGEREELPNDYADLIIGKGHAREPKEVKKPESATSVDTPKGGK